MAHAVDRVIEWLSTDPDAGPECARAVKLMKDAQKKGLVSLSLGTWAPGHPTDTEEWAKHWSDMMEEMLLGGAVAIPDWIGFDRMHDAPWKQVWVVYSFIARIPYYIRKWWMS